MSWLRGGVSGIRGVFAAIGCGVMLMACATVLPTATGSPAPGITVPSCPPISGCGEGFLLDGVFYGPVCVRVRDGAVERSALATSTSQYAEVRRISGLTDDFLAVRGKIPCGPPDPAQWWLAQGDASPAELDAARARLSQVVFTP